MLIQIRRVRETPITRSMGEQNHTLPNIDEHADFAAAFLHVLVASAFVLCCHAAYRLRAEDGTAEETDGWIGDFLACGWTFAFDGFFREGVICFWQSNELEDGRVRNGQ